MGVSWVGGWVSGEGAGSRFYFLKFVCFHMCPFIFGFSSTLLLREGEVEG